MPRIPTLDPQVRFGPGPTPPSPTTLHPPEEAFGGSIGQADVGLGKTVEGAGKLFTDRYIALQDKVDEQKGLELQEKIRNDFKQSLADTTVDSKTKLPKGYLARQLDQAQGASAQFAQTLPNLKKQYVDMAVGQNMKDQVSKAFDVHSSNFHDLVSQHEAEQRQKSFELTGKQSLESSVSDAAAIIKPEGLTNAIKLAQANRVAVLKHNGYNEAQISPEMDDLAGKMLTSNVTALLDSNPQLARRIFDANKNLVSPDDAAKIRDKIIGKELFDKKMNVWNTVRDSPAFKLPDGTIDIQKVSDFVTKQQGTNEDREKILPFVQGLAGEANTELKAKWAANDRNYNDQLLKLHQSGGTFLDAIPLAATNSRDNLNLSEREETARKLFSGSMDRFDVWYKKADQGQRHAWADAQEQIVRKYGNNSWTLEDGSKEKAAKLVTQELQSEIVDKRGQITGPQLTDLVKERLAKVEVGPYQILGMKVPFLTKTEPSAQVEINARRLNDTEMARLETNYGAARVAQAKQKLESEGRVSDPQHIANLLIKQYGVK